MLEGRNVSGYEVPVEELRGHADRLRGVEDQLNQALDAARQVSMSGEAYGKICTMFPPIVSFVSGAGIESLSECVTSVGDTIASVRGAADDYEDVDRGNASAFAGGAA